MDGPNPASLEQQITALQQQLEAKKEALKRSLGEQEQMPSDKEILRSVVRERHEQISQQLTPAPSAGTPPPGAVPATDTPSYQLPGMAEEVQRLVDIAFSQSLDGALKAAAQTHNAALIDAFHDVLTDQLAVELAKRQNLPSPE